MKDRSVLRTIAVAIWALLLVWDTLMVLVRANYQVPQLHKEILLGGVLLWFVTTIFDTRINDDDWAGEF